MTNEVTAQKLRGGYYTPLEVADWLTSWATPLGDERVLEPSCGDGAFLTAAARRSANLQVTGIELDPAEAEKAAACHPHATVINEDFFTWLESRPADGEFDAVVGNPPFIRFQHFPERYRDRALRLMMREGLRPSRLTNAWLPFVVGATRALREGGRLAIVLPAELLQVGYAADLRHFLSTKYAQLQLVGFDELIFPGILQETVLLLGVRKDCEAARISTRQLKDASELAATRVEDGVEAAELDHSREKWTQYYLDPPELTLLRACQSLSSMQPLGTIASVDVGIVTGRNEFFVLRPSEAATRKINDRTRRLVGRSAQIPGLVLRDSEWQELHATDGRVLLFDPAASQRSELGAGERRYVEYGEDRGFDTGYKCRIRKPAWWRVPSSWVPDAFLLRQIYDGPRLVLNDASATCTDTIHRVRFGLDVDRTSISAVFSNSLTWALAEVRGRSYGGGVLELEPREAEELLVPVVPNLGHLVDIEKLDRLQRDFGSLAVLQEVDSTVLASVGIDRRDRERLHGIWQKLALRRGGRRLIGRASKSREPIVGVHK